VNQAPIATGNNKAVGPWTLVAAIGIIPSPARNTNAATASLLFLANGRVHHTIPADARTMPAHRVSRKRPALLLKKLYSKPVLTSTNPHPTPTTTKANPTAVASFGRETDTNSMIPLLSL